MVVGIVIISMIIVIIVIIVVIVSELWLKRVIKPKKTWVWHDA